MLPNGTVWLPALVGQIVEVASGPTTSIFVDKKLIDGPNANERGKWLIPLIIIAQVRSPHHSLILIPAYIPSSVLMEFMLCYQYFLVVRPIRKAIDKDLVEEKNQRPQWEIRAEEFRRNTTTFDDDQADEQAISQAFQQDLGDQLGGFDDDDDDEDY